MQTHQPIWKYFQQYNVVSFVVRTSAAAALALLLAGATLGGKNAGGTEASTFQSSCARSGQAYTAASGDAIKGTAERSGTNESALAAHSGNANSSSVYPNQTICIPDGSTTRHIATSTAMSKTVSAPAAPTMLMRAQVASTAQQVHATSIGAMNTFPYGACTWYADQRYQQLHGIFVPWRSNANAWQWNARAYDYGWRVSGSPSVGSIIVLQSGVQGASGLGHVGVVERVVGNGTVIASSMNWGANPSAVSSWQFHAGPGVSFVSQ